MMNNLNLLNLCINYNVVFSVYVDPIMLAQGCEQLMFKCEQSSYLSDSKRIFTVEAGSDYIVVSSVKELKDLTLFPSRSIDSLDTFIDVMSIYLKEGVSF